MDVFLWKRIKRCDLGFFIFNCLFVMAIQENGSMQCFLEVGVEGLGGHVNRFFLATMHEMEKAIVSGNRASSGGNIIKMVLWIFRKASGYDIISQHGPVRHNASQQDISSCIIPPAWSPLDISPVNWTCPPAMQHLQPKHLPWTSPPAHCPSLFAIFPCNISLPNAPVQKPCNIYLLLNNVFQVLKDRIWTCAVCNGAFISTPG